MWLKKTLFILPFLFFGTSAFGAEIRGKVKVIGSSINQYVAVAQKGKQKSDKLCSGSLVKKLRSFVNLEIKISGSKKKKCFEVSSFDVVAMPSGRKPFIGTLSARGEGFIFTDAKGEVVVFDSIPAALKNYLGKKILMDADIVSTSKKKSIKLISFIVYP